MYTKYFERIPYVLFRFEKDFHRKFMNTYTRMSLSQIRKTNIFAHEHTVRWMKMGQVYRHQLRIEFLG